MVHPVKDGHGALVKSSEAPSAVGYAGSSKSIPFASDRIFHTEGFMFCRFHLRVSTVTTGWQCAAGPALTLGLHMGLPPGLHLEAIIFTKPPAMVPVAQADKALRSGEKSATVIFSKSMCNALASTARLSTWRTLS